MNKLVKGAIASAAGVALLLGGAGTFALWNSSVGVLGGAISAGNLVVSDTNVAGVWKLGNNVISLLTYKASPGDVLTYTKTENILATGSDLSATLSLGLGSIAPAVSTTAADIALASYLTTTSVVSASGTGIVASGNNYTITAGTAGVTSVVTVTATITFPKDLLSNVENSMKLGNVNFANLAVVLTQV
jgi:alternate signal-mediated exported protein